MYLIRACSKRIPKRDEFPVEVLHYKFIRGVCAARTRISATTHSQNFLSDIDTQSQNIEEVTKTIRRQRDKESRAGNDNFCPKWPLEQSSDLSMFLNSKNT